VIGRRTLLRLLAIPAAVARLQPGRATAQAFSLSPPRMELLGAVASTVLPSEVGRAGMESVVQAFVRWQRNYREGAEMDHGYGVTRLRRTGRAPSLGYAEQLDAIEAAASRQGAAFAALSHERRLAILAEALSTAGVERLPARPDGRHVAADLMAFYFRSAAATDLCYGARIGRDACRGLSDSSQPPSPLADRP
jgi:hypothetical protein